MTDNNNIESFFKNTLAEYEAPVDSSLWKGIEEVVSQPAGVSSVAGQAAVGKTVAISKILIAAASVLVAGVMGYALLNSNSDTLVQQNVNENTTVNEKNSVSETIAQPIPEKIVTEKPTRSSSDVQQSSPEIFSTTSSIEETKEQARVSLETSPSTPTQIIIAPKPSEIPGSASTAPSTVLPVEQNKLQQTPSAKVEEDKEKKAQDVKEDPAKPNVALTLSGLDKQAFTPNGDGKNDAFSINDEALQTVNVKIYHSGTHKLVYQWNEIGGSWNGNFADGNEAPAGFYLVVVTGTGTDGQKYKRTTSLQLIRRN